LTINDTKSKAIDDKVKKMTVKDIDDFIAKHCNTLGKEWWRM